MAAIAWQTQEGSRKLLQELLLVQIGWRTSMQVQLAMARACAAHWHAYPPASLCNACGKHRWSAEGAARILKLPLGPTTCEKMVRAGVLNLGTL